MAKLSISYHSSAVSSSNFKVASCDKGTMRIIKAPLRISLFGGGTDLPEYFNNFGSTIVSFAINRHIYLTHNPRPTGGYRVTYAKVEELNSLAEAEHTLIRAAEERYGLGGPCTLSIVSDLPKGTGLGSSSSLAVALVTLVLGELEPEELAREAYELERQVSPVGVQDHLPAAFGGFHVYEINEKATEYEFAMDCGLLLYTGITRQANAILEGMKCETAILHEIHALAAYVREALPDLSMQELGKLLNGTWLLKRRIPGVSTPELDWQYAEALKAGAWGGKLCGAGNGGCWFFIVSPDERSRVRDALNLIEIPFRVSPTGVESCER